MEEESEGKDPLVTLLLSIFFGWCGLDRFYRGAYFTGILKLISFGGLGIWWLIDILLSLTGEEDIFKL
jgi:TM2 domain-containing membrane protein YozV